MSNETQATIRIKRPFFLTFLCIIGFTYTTLFSILFLLGMLYSTGISGILNKYMQIYDLSRMNFFVFSISGFLIFFALFLGVYLMWRMQWLGFYIYTAAAILYLGMEMLLEGFYLPDIVIHSTFLVLYLISFLYVRKRRRALSRIQPENQVAEGQ